jgi:hypothetical protein
MTDTLRVILEIGTKRRVVAGAMDWPGLDRWGISEDDALAARVSPELRPGPRSAGRSRDQIIRHVYINEPEQLSRKVEVRTPPELVLTPDGLATHRQAYLAAIRAYNAEGKPARTWPIQFLVRRTAHHVMDHAWEMEDRETGAPSAH